MTYHCWCWPWLHGWGSVFWFIHCKVSFAFPLHFRLHYLEGNLYHRPHWNLRCEYYYVLPPYGRILHKLFGNPLHGYLLYTLSYTRTPLYLLCSSNCSRNRHSTLSQLPFLFDTVPSIWAFVCILLLFSEPVLSSGTIIQDDLGSSCIAPASVLESPIYPRSPGCFYSRMVLRPRLGL